MKKLVLTAAVFAAILSASAAFAASGVVNADEVLANYAKFTQARQQLAALVQQKEAAVRAEKDAAKQQQMAAEARRQLVQEERRIMDPVIKGVQAAVAKVAKAKNLDTVVHSAMVLYGGTDITKDVIAALR